MSNVSQSQQKTHALKSQSDFMLQIAHRQVSSGKKMVANTKERFASLNSGNSENILTEKDSKSTKWNTETAVLFKVYLREKEL